MTLVECPACGAKHAPSEPNPTGTTACPRCGHAIPFPAATDQAETVTSVPANPDAAPTLSRGDVTTVEHGPISIPGYEILQEVGRGGMGVVYKAKQHNPPRLVALKMILAGEHADPEQLARFHTEAEAIARLTHPTIAHIHQVGEWRPPTGGPPVPFLTLEFVPGTSLALRLKSGVPIEPRQAAGLIRQLALGVHYAHEQGIVHRDLKPGNILLSGKEGPDSLGEPKIVDFGLAKPLDGFASTMSDNPQTRTGSVLGTPGYMSPEQASSKKTIGPATDVYALGAILYELLTGRPPFAGESTLETLMQVTSEEPLPPHHFRPRLPRDLETVCLTCLAKLPERRYASAEALAKDLARFLSDRPVKVRPPSRVERLRRWARRNKELAYLAAGALVALAVVFVIVLTRPNPSTDSQAEAQNNPKPQPPNPGPPDEDTPIAKARRRMNSQNNLKQIAIALHNMHDAHGSFPPAATCDKDGKPLLSWRVALLPYIEQDELYKRFKLDEPWDCPNNKPLIDKMPRTYAVEGKGPPNTTHYQAAVGKGTAWEQLPQLGGPFGRMGLRLAAFTDGTSNTILVAEVANPVIWSKPDDLSVDSWQNPQFGGVVKGGFNVAMADGSVWFVRDTVRPQDLRAALTRNGGEILPDDWRESGRPSQTFPPVGRVVKRGPEVELTGKVTCKGKSLPYDTRVFLTQIGGNGFEAGAHLSEDGTYFVPRIESGEYRVTISPPANPPLVYPKLPARYADPNTSGLTVTVGAAPGRQTADFDLTDDVPKKK